jgi:hypothetical protein
VIEAGEVQARRMREVLVDDVVVVAPVVRHGRGR